MAEIFSRDKHDRRKILASLIGCTLFAALSFRGTTAAAKVAQNAAQYQPTPKGGQACAGCNFFVGPNHCKLIAGEISPTGWCRLWAKKEG